MITDLEDSVLALLLRKIAPGKLGHPLLGWRKRTGQPDRRASFDSSRTPEGLLPLKKKASDLRVLILFDGDKEGSPTPETSGWDKVVFGIQVIAAPALNGMNAVFLSVPRPEQ
jgi:hypothetical protein